jgi:hypothetical protein
VCDELSKREQICCAFMPALYISRSMLATRSHSFRGSIVHPRLFEAESESESEMSAEHRIQMSSAGATAINY